MPCSLLTGFHLHLARECAAALPFRHHQTFRRFIGRFTFVRLRKPHVTVVSLPFPETLTTSSLRKTQHQVVWSVFLQTLTGGPTSIQIEVQKVVLFSTSLSSFRNTRNDLFCRFIQYICYCDGLMSSRSDRVHTFPFGSLYNL